LGYGAGVETKAGLDLRSSMAWHRRRWFLGMTTSTVRSLPTEIPLDA
jgi:hypothetical protein